MNLKKTIILVFSDKMTNVSLVNLNIVKKKNKLNAESYSSLETHLYNLLEKSEICVEFNNLIDSIKKGRYVKPSSNGNIRLLTSRNIKKLEIVEEPVNYISEPTSQLKINDLLISINSNMIDTAVLIENDENLCINSNIIKISVNENINPYYVATFLNSKYGLAQFNLNISGSLINSINLKSIKKFLIPILSESFQLNLEKLIKVAHEKRKLAKEKYLEAESILHEFLNIKNEVISLNKSYEINSEEISKDFRLDANYYNPDYIKSINIIKNSPFGMKKFKDIVNFSNEYLDISNKKYRAKKFKYFSPNDIQKSGEIIEFKDISSWEIQNNSKKLENSDIIINSLDKIALVHLNSNRQITNENVFVIKSKEYFPEFLFLFFRSAFFKKQLERNIRYNTDIIPKNELIKTFIPIVSKEEQKEISNLIKEYFQLRTESREIILDSIHKLEEEIEKCLQQ